ncbi:Alpha-(1,3)-fucosyltransferase 9, partial [Schistosoma haematobium]
LYFAEKIILNYGNIRINIIRNFSFCFACDCELIFDRSRWLEADVILLTDRLYPKGPRPPNQLWFIYVHESPTYIRIADGLENKVNYTISYRTDSTIYVPYHNYIPFVASHGPDTKYVLPSHNYATGKSKMVAWFVSNCQPKNPRMMYVKELSRHIQVRTHII